MVATHSNMLVVWDPNNKNPLILDRNAYCGLAVLRKSNRIAAGSTHLGSGFAYRPVVRLFRASLPKARSVEGPEDRVADMAISPDSNWVATAHYSGNVCLWELADPRKTAVITNSENFASDKYKGISVLNPRLTKLSFEADGRHLGTRNSLGEFQEWDTVAKTAAPATRPSSGLKCSAFTSSTARRLLAFGHTDGSIDIVAPNTFQVLGHRPRPSYGGYRCCVSPPMVPRLASRGGDGVIRDLGCEQWLAANDKKQAV